MWPVPAPAAGAQAGECRSKSEARLKATLLSWPHWVRSLVGAPPAPARPQFFCCSAPIGRWLWPGSDGCALGNSKSGHAQALAEPSVPPVPTLPGGGGRILSKHRNPTLGYGPGGAFSFQGWPATRDGASSNSSPTSLQLREAVEF